MNKKIITIVSLVLALVFVVSLSMVFSKVNRMTTESNSELSRLKITNSNRLEQLDGTVITGAEVKDIINTYRETSDGIKLSYLVSISTIIDDGTTFKSYGYGRIAHTGASQVNGLWYKISSYPNSNYVAYKELDPTHKHYINNSRGFQCNVIKQYNKIIGIWFEGV